MALRPNAASFHANLAKAFRRSASLSGLPEAVARPWVSSPTIPRRSRISGCACRRWAGGEAAEQFREAIKLRPGFASAHSNLGNVLRESGRMDEALVHFRRAVELGPGDALAVRTWARCSWNAILRWKPCRIAKRQSGFCRTPRRCITIWGTPAAGCIVTRTLGRLTSRHAARPLPGEGEAQLGIVLKHEGRLDEAAVCLKRAIELDPADPDLAEFLGDLCRRQAGFCRGDQLLLAGIAISRVEKSRLHVSLGWALQEEGRLGKAHTQF